jgi:hypothetical protein
MLLINDFLKEIAILILSIEIMLKKKYHSVLDVAKI